MAEQRPDDPRRQPALNAFRISFVVVTVAALVLGYLGLDGFLRGSTEYGHRPWDLLYYDLQLFVLGADPLQQAGPYPLELQFARFAAPAATIYALVEGFRLLSAAELRRIRARNSHGHVVVCGDAPLADALSHRLRAAGRRVVDVRSAPVDPVSGGGAGRLLVIGDGRDPEVLRAAGIDRATALYACDTDSTANMAIGLAAGRARQQPRRARQQRLRQQQRAQQQQRARRQRAGRPGQPPGHPQPAPGGAWRPAEQPLAVYAHIQDSELCLTLQARYLGLPQPPGLRLDFFNIDDLAARKLFVTEPLATANGQAPRLLVAGDTAFAKAVVVEAARHWRSVHDPEFALPLPVTLVSEAAGDVLDQLVHRYPFLAKVCRFTVHRADLLQLLTGGSLHDPPDRAFICHGDEQHALKTALIAERLWHGGPHSVTVRLDQLAAFRDELDPHDQDRLFAETPGFGDGSGPAGGSGTLRVYGVLHAASDPDLIGEDLVERLARVIHDSYRVARHRRGDTTQTNPSMVPWHELPPALRQTNRDQAEDIGRKLRAIGCVLVPRSWNGRGGTLSESDIERLAMMEHERWRAERAAAGWRYAEQRDDIRKYHPALLDWPQLPEQMRLRNQDAVREVPAILADAGFEIIRG